MPTAKAVAPERELQGHQCEPDTGRDSQSPSCASSIVNHSRPNVNIRTRSRIVPALVIGFVLFAVCYLAAHVAAAICGWRFVVYGGASIGVVLFMAVLVACAVAAVRDD